MTKEWTEMLIEIVQVAIEGAVARGIAKARVVEELQDLQQAGKVQEATDSLLRSAVIERDELAERVAAAEAELSEALKECRELLKERQGLRHAVEVSEDLAERAAALVSQARAVVEAVAPHSLSLDADAVSKTRQLDRQLDGWPDERPAGETLGTAEGRAPKWIGK